MADTFEDRVAKLAALGRTAIQIHEQFRKEGLAIPWLSVLRAYQVWQAAKQSGR
jgi:hypothetical protein